MRSNLVTAMALATCTVSMAQGTEHRYTQEERYAGCLFGDSVPLLRRGYSRNAALSIASRKCESLSTGLSPSQVQEVSDYVNSSIDDMER